MTRRPRHRQGSAARRSSLQPDSRTFQLPAVVSNKDNFSPPTPSFCLLTEDCETANTKVACPSAKPFEVQPSAPPMAASTLLTTPAAQDAMVSKIGSANFANSLPVTVKIQEEERKKRDEEER